MERGHQYRRASSGFSLIELVIVIGILVLLFSLVLSYADKCWKVARRVNCMSNMHQVSVGYFQYAADNEGKLPASEANTTIVGMSSDAQADLPYLRNYVGDARAFHCPEDIRGPVRSYAINDYLGGTFLGITHVWQLHNIQNAPSTLLLIEEQAPATRNAATGGFVILPAPGFVWADTPAILHEHGTCLCMADGHVEYWQWNDPRTWSLPQTAFPRTPQNLDLTKLQAIAGSTASTTN